MLMKDCRGCIYKRRMIGVGLGVRCSNQHNIDTYATEEAFLVMISHVLDCKLKETKSETT